MSNILIKQGKVIGGGGGGGGFSIEDLYDLRSTNTTVSTNQQGNKVITERDNTNEITCVTTIIPTSDTVKTITAVITPDAGDLIYTKTTVITTTSGGKTIAESYTTSEKEEE